MSTLAERLAAVALRLISANGRACTLLTRVASPADSSKPWRGPGTAEPTVTASVTGLFTNLSYDVVTGEFTKRAGERLLVPAAATDADLRGCTLVVDGDRTMEIERIGLVQPGGTPILWQIELKT